jgi:AcrR family transcriptional regulator
MFPLYPVRRMGIREPAPPPRVLPRGRHAASREIVWRSQQERLLEAMAQAVAEKGYARVAVADVIERAGVSRKTFYEHFASKEACFLAAYDAGVGAMLAAIEREIHAAAPDWLGGAEAGTRCYLETLAANGAFARTYLVEVLAAGPDALERRTQVHERFADLLEATYRTARKDVPALPEPGRHIYRAAVGAVDELVTDALLRRGADALPAMLPAVVEAQMSLLVGRELAEQLRQSR